MFGRTLRVATLLLVTSCASGGARPAPGGTGGDEDEGGTGGASPVEGGRGGGTPRDAAPSNSGGMGGTAGATEPSPDAAVTGGAGGAPAERPDGGALAPDAAKGPPPAGNGFRHPGVMINQGQLDFLRGKIMAGEQPWKAAYDKASADNYGSLTYAPMPRAVVECGPYSTPNLGCAEEANDSIAAYTHALLFVLGGDEAHARKSIEIMNAWATTFKSHTNSNGPLQAGWYGAIWPRAGELIRSAYPGWPQAEQDRFKAMLRSAYLPAVINGSGANGNWELSMIEATINMAVFLDDKASFDKATAMWKKRVPAYFYLKSDGATPVKPPRGSANWGTSYYVDGLCQETCRDFLHTQLGFGAAINAAETAFQQGVDLYAAESQRLRTTMEFHADLLLGKPPGAVCGGTVDLRVLNTWQIAYNHYQTRAGQSLPLTLRLITEKARAIDPTYKHMSWETLTHADVGWAGLR
jgi:hypothetical protein